MPSENESGSPPRRIKLRSLSRLKKEGKDRPGQTVMRRYLTQSLKRLRPRGGWRNP